MLFISRAFHVTKSCSHSTTRVRFRFSLTLCILGFFIYLCIVVFIDYENWSNSLIVKIF